MSTADARPANASQLDAHPLVRLRLALENVMCAGHQLDVDRWYEENGRAFDALRELEEADASAHEGDAEFFRTRRRLLGLPEKDGL